MRLLLALGLAVFAMACQSRERTIDSESRYTPPASHAVESGALLEMDMDEAWARLAQSLEAEALQVLAADKDAGFYVVELLPRKPARPVRDFVDCGAVDRSVTIEAQSERFAYRIADPSQDRVVESLPDHFVVRDLDRAVDLKVRATLFLKPVGEMRTQLTLNARYEVIVKISGRSQQIPRDGGVDPLPAEPLDPERRVAAFTSFAEGAFSESDSIRCRATGEVERIMLALAEAGTAIR